MRWRRMRVPIARQEAPLAYAQRGWMRSHKRRQVILPLNIAVRLADAGDRFLDKGSVSSVVTLPPLMQRFLLHYAAFHLIHISAAFKYNHLKEVLW